MTSVVLVLAAWFGLSLLAGLAWTLLHGDRQPEPGPDPATPLGVPAPRSPAADDAADRQRA